MTVNIPAQGYAPSITGTLSWVYDGTDHIYSETSTLSAGFSYSYLFGFDPADNLTTLRGSTQTYNNDNQITTGGAYAWDGNGNPTTYQGTGVTFDYENRVTQITGAYSAAYRADGKRGWKNVGGTKTYYLYDGDQVVCEVNAAGNVAYAYGYGPNGLAQRYDQGINEYRAFTFSPDGAITQRHRQYDTTVLAADTVLWDSFGSRLADIDALTGGTYPVPDSSGFGGQWGAYTDV